jgi:hypothetical protein
MFDLVVNKFGFLKHVPLLPHIYDGGMKIQKLFFDRNILIFMDEIEEEVLSWKNTSARIHKFGGMQFDAGAKEIGHIHGNGVLDILFSREIKNKLIAENKACEHHTFKNSGWISFYIRTKEDKIAAVELLRSSYSRVQEK